MSTRRAWLLGIAVFAVSLLLSAPAALVYGWTRPKSGPAMIEAYGLEGSLAAGRVGSLAVANRTVAHDLAWRFKFWQLPLLRLAFHVEGQGNDLFSGAVFVAPGHRLGVRGLAGMLGVKGLTAAAGFPLPMDGQAKLDLKRLDVKNGVPTQATGTADLQGLAWTLARDPLLLGDFHADAQTLTDGIHVKLSSTSGPLELEGEAQLAPDRAYKADLQLRARPEADPRVAELIRSLGAPDTRGFYHFKRSGKLP